MLPSQCKQAKTKESDIESVCDILKSKINEIKDDTKKSKVLRRISTSFEIKEIENRTQKNNHVVMYPRLETSITMRSKLFDRLLNGENYNLANNERLALKMINYMVYVETEYASTVNVLCYIFAQTISPRCPGINKKSTIKSISRNFYLGRRIEFLKCNLPNIPENIPNITTACNTDLRNMIAHGRLVGGPLPTTEYSGEYDIVYVQKGHPTWQWCKNPVKLDDEYARMVNITEVWCSAIGRCYD